MGLDMYLDKHIYIGAEFAHRNVKGTISLTNDKGRIPIDLKKVSEVVERAAYWRKANAIHQWFVDNVQNGNDECQRSYVSREDLQHLLDTVNAVIPTLKVEHKKTIQVATGWNSEGTTYGDSEVFTDIQTAEEMLPTQGGFFFGSTDYDEYYLEDLKYTKEVLTELLNEPESWDVSYYYRASW